MDTQLTIIFNSCLPSPCGPNSLCHDNRGNPSCSCAQNYIGIPPNCQPECIINSDCPLNLACMRERCMNPCPGSCGVGAKCNVVNHAANCVCPEGFTGDAFTICLLRTPICKFKLIDTYCIIYTIETLISDFTYF